MYSIELMVREHENILKFLGVIRSACCGILEGAPVDDGDFRDMISFARNYADKHHHGKEEQILFREMTGRLGRVGENLIQHGMLVEHDLGRLHIAELENALNRCRGNPQTADKLGILTEAMGYANLLRRHIEKENQVVYPYAEKSLPDGTLRLVDERVAKFEEEAEDAPQACLRLLQRLSEKYPPEFRDLPGAE